jgi:hypothetical protein
MVMFTGSVVPAGPVDVADLRAFVAAYVCGPGCDYDPRRLVAENCHSFSTRMVPLEPTLLDLIGWRG